MRATEFTTSNIDNQLLPINEVAMNPTAYAQSIETGESSGVLIGFEFEVCVPQAAIKSYHEAERAAAYSAALAVPQLPVTAQRVGRIIKQNPSSLWRGSQGDDMIKFDRYFTPIDTANYPSMTAAKKSTLDKRVETTKEIISQLPADLLPGFKRLSRAKIQRRIRTNNYGYELSPEQKELEVLADIAARYYKHVRTDPQYHASRGLENRSDSWRREHRASNYNSDEAVANRALDELINNLWGLNGDVRVSEIFRMMWPDVSEVFRSEDNVVSAVMHNINGLFTYDPLEVYNAYSLADIDPDVPNALRPNMSRNPPSDFQGYRGAALVLNSSLKKTMNSEVIVYDRYHQETKDMTSWYIEPDGSLRPNGFDGAAEIVGPPESPKAALTSLRKFFTMASELKLYTSKRNNTGLHINVSIPKELDVLKLAVMLGDEYILKKFDRENNNYAKSVMNYLKTPNSENVASTVSSDIKTAYGSTESKINLDLLKQIAERISGDHFSSINWTGKYISFRHAGGDYLKDYNEILNVVGRFVRAMVIASDPTAYRNEYLKAVVKLVNQRQPVVLSDNARYIKYIKENGLVVKTIDMYLKKDSFNNPSIQNFQTVLSIDYKLVPEVNYSITTSSELAQQKLITKSSSSGRARVLMSDPEKSPVQQFAHCEIIPYTMDMAQVERQNEYRGVHVQYTFGGAIAAGYKYIAVKVIPATDPRAIKFMRALRTTQPRY